MLKDLQRISAVLFYLLGTSFFVGYLLYANLIGGVWPAWWMQVADLPLILSAILYGGLSLFLSITKSEAKSITAAIVVGIPLATLFIFLLLLNFWNVIF